MPRPSPAVIGAVALWCAAAGLIAATLAWITGDLGLGLATAGRRAVYGCAGACTIVFALGSATCGSALGRSAAMAGETEGSGFFWKLTLATYLATLAAYGAVRGGYWS